MATRSKTKTKTKAKSKSGAKAAAKAVARPVDKAAAKLAAKAAQLIKVRRSRVHGQGVFALQRIRKGTRIIEYVGDRISHARANRLIREMAVNTPRVGFVDTFDVPLDASGQARPELFVKDRLHFSPEGYKLLADRVRPYLN